MGSLWHRRASLPLRCSSFCSGWCSIAGHHLLLPCLMGKQLQAELALLRRCELTYTVMCAQCAKSFIIQIIKTLTLFFFWGGEWKVFFNPIYELSKWYVLSHCSLWIYSPTADGERAGTLTPFGNANPRQLAPVVDFKVVISEFKRQRNVPAICRLLQGSNTWTMEAVFMHPRHLSPPDLTNQPVTTFMKSKPSKAPDLQNCKSSILHSFRMISYRLFLLKEKPSNQGLLLTSRASGCPSLSRVETGRGGGSKGILSRKGKIRHVFVCLLPWEAFCNTLLRSLRRN